ncbi:MAG: molybdopterin-dependent oxidoreductase [Nannocystaceae bacterium]|nr:molybdopterin-dependent oxidoreductase [bacterium]
MPRSHTFCRICEAACGLVAQRDEAGELVGLRPDKDHPASHGFACAKGTRFVEVATHPDRVLHPSIEGRRAPWPEALDWVAERIRAIRAEHGPHALGVYFGNPMAFNTLGIAAIVRMVAQLGTRNVFFAGSQDCNNKFAGSHLVHGNPFVHPIPDFEHADLAVVFGSNPYVSQSSFVHLEGGSARAFGGIIERGGEVVWVDPRRTESAKRWGRHLPIRPAGDAWLLVALLARLGSNGHRADRVEGFEELVAAARRFDIDDCLQRAGIEREAFERLVGDIRRAKRTALHMSVGVNMSGFGTIAYVLMQALSYATGNLDREGGSVFAGSHAPVRWIARRVGLLAEAHARVGGFRSTVRSLPGGILADEILTPGPERIRALLVIGGDPLRSIPGGSKLEGALKELELLTCIDMFESRTAKHAHVFLPATSWLERWDLGLASIPFQAKGRAQLAGPLMEPRGEARNDGQILAELATRLGLRGPLWSLLRRDPSRWFPAPRKGVPLPSARPGTYLARNRVSFWNESIAEEIGRLHAEPAPPTDGLRIIGRRRRLGHNSWLHGGKRDGAPEAAAWMHPDDLEGRGIRDGATVELSTAHGRLRIAVKPVPDVARGTVVVPHGLHGLSLNDIVPSGPEHIERVSGQAVMSGVPVEVRAVQ